MDAAGRRRGRQRRRRRRQGRRHAPASTPTPRCGPPACRRRRWPPSWPKPAAPPLDRAGRIAVLPRPHAPRTPRGVRDRRHGDRAQPAGRRRGGDAGRSARRQHDRPPAQGRGRGARSSTGTWAAWRPSGASGPSPACAELRLSGFAGWLVWFFVHLAFLTGFGNRLHDDVSRWLRSMLGRGRGRAGVQHGPRRRRPQPSGAGARDRPAQPVPIGARRRRHRRGVSRKRGHQHGPPVEQLGRRTERGDAVAVHADRRVRLLVGLPHRCAHRSRRRRRLVVRAPVRRPERLRQLVGSRGGNVPPRPVRHQRPDRAPLRARHQRARDDMEDPVGLGPRPRRVDHGAHPRAGHGHAPHPATRRRRCRVTCWCAPPTASRVAWRWNWCASPCSRYGRTAGRVVARGRHEPRGRCGRRRRHDPLAHRHGARGGGPPRARPPPAACR